MSRNAYRDEHLVVEIIGSWANGDGIAESAWVRDTERRLDASAVPGGWPNLMARGAQRVRDAYGINSGRLLAGQSALRPRRSVHGDPAAGMTLARPTDVEPRGTRRSTHGSERPVHLFLERRWCRMGRVKVTYSGVWDAV
jgi:hypothetical protein